MALFRSDGRTDARTHGHTDGQTFTNHPCTIGKFFFFFFLHICEGKGGKLYNPYEISTSSLREVRFAHFTREGQVSRLVGLPRLEFGALNLEPKV